MKAYQGASVAVLGFGRSGRAAVDFLLPLGARVTVYATNAPPLHVMAQYRAQGVAFSIGAFPTRFAQSLLIRSPGIRPDIPTIEKSLAAGSVLTSEVELLLEHCPGRVIGVTGSDGKTTTSALIATLLKGAGKRVHLGGNNGTPLLPCVEEMTADDLAVVELSSFQLMTVERAPHVSVITNITPNHLNWHTGMEEYITAKRRIVGRNTARLVVNGACPITREIGERTHVPVTYFSVKEKTLFLTDETGERRISVPDTFRLPGVHNLENLAAACAAVGELAALDGIEASLADFRGVDHRLQYVDTVHGVKYYNSSIDTSPTRTAAALTALGGSPIVIVGGRGKGIPFDALAGALALHAKAVFLYGEAGDEIRRALAGRVPTHRFAAFAAAFYAAAASARPGDTVLLSPGCTAFDQFRDFEERGEVFCQMVRELKE